MDKTKACNVSHGCANVSWSTIILTEAYSASHAWMCECMVTSSLGLGMQTFPRSALIKIFQFGWVWMLKEKQMRCMDGLYDDNFPSCHAHREAHGMFHLFQQKKISIIGLSPMACDWSRILCRIQQWLGCEIRFPTVQMDNINTHWSITLAACNSAIRPKRFGGLALLNLKYMNIPVMLALMAVKACWSYLPSSAEGIGSRTLLSNKLSTQCSWDLRWAESIWSHSGRDMLTVRWFFQAGLKHKLGNQITHSSRWIRSWLSMKHSSR